MKRRIKRNILWALINARAVAEGIDRKQLGRVAAYLDSRFRLSSDGSEHPAQQPSAFFPGLRSVPVYDESFPWVDLLNEHAESIQREFQALRERIELKPHPQKLADAGSWDAYYLYSNGIRYDDHCAECPVTASIVEQIDGGGEAGQAYFSVMAAGTHVKPHCGPTNSRIRCHLGLEVPDSAVIRVADTMQHWRQLGCIVFDDSFEHEIWNPEEERAVFIIDVWHPDLSSEERWALGALSRLSGRHRDYQRGIAKNA